MSTPTGTQYGSAFPALPAGQPGATDLPYLGDFSELEWRVGEVAVEVDGDGLTDAAERAISADKTLDPGQALVSLIATGLVTAIEHSSERSAR